MSTEIKTSKKTRNDYPHLVQLEKEVKQLKFDTKEYWKARAQYLEKSLDPTYSDFERDNCTYFWYILSHTMPSI